MLCSCYRLRLICSLTRRLQDLQRPPRLPIPSPRPAATAAALAVTSHSHPSVSLLHGRHVPLPWTATKLDLFLRGCERWAHSHNLAPLSSTAAIVGLYCIWSQVEEHRMVESARESRQIHLLHRQVEVSMEECKVIHFRFKIGMTILSK